MESCSVVLERIDVDEYSHKPQDHSSSPPSRSQLSKAKRQNPQVSPPRIRVLRNRNIPIAPVAKKVSKKYTEILQQNKKEQTSDVDSVTNVRNVEVFSRMNPPTTAKAKKIRNERCPPSKSNLKKEQSAPVNPNVTTANDNAAASINVQIHLNLCANEVSKKTPNDLAASCLEDFLSGINDYLKQKKSASSAARETTTSERNGTMYCVILLLRFHSNNLFLIAYRSLARVAWGAIVE